MKVTGKIEKILETTKGVKDGREWKKISFTLRTNEQYNNLYCFDIFGSDKVDNFEKYNKEGSYVDVDFNVKCNEWKGKYFTSLDAWKIFKAENDIDVVDAEEIPANLQEAKAKIEKIMDEDDLPF